MKGWRLLGDIGGTNARFARSESAGELFALRTYDVAAFTNFNQAFETYLADTDGLEGCEAAAVCAAGPVLDGRVKLTNAPWHIGAAEISRLAGNIPVALYNDLEAVALALPHLGSTDVAPLGTLHAPSDRRERMLAINVGTGFGAAVISPSDGTWTTCPSEAGHMAFGAQDELELSLLAGGDFTGFTVEDALSGQGLVNLYRKQCDRLGTQASAAAADEVISQVSSDAAADATLRVFTVWLGRVARNLTLATSAWGGVFFTGGVIQGWHSLASSTHFRTSFEASRKMGEYLRQTYTGVITRAEISLLGLARAPVV
ncbi:MAG: glucokinase [Hyphomicrobiales bacterium]|nr:glucokinase [Hyphomicrobiales bacterium]